MGYEINEKNQCQKSFRFVLHSRKTNAATLENAIEILGFNSVETDRVIQKFVDMSLITKIYTKKDTKKNHSETVGAIWFSYFVENFLGMRLKSNTKRYRFA